MKRYFSEQEILDEIDNCRKRSLKFLASAEELEARAAELFREPNMKEHAIEARKLAAGRRVRARNLMEKKSRELGKALAEFRTTPMFGEINSVQIK